MARVLKTQVIHRISQLNEIWTDNLSIGAINLYPSSLETIARV